MKKMSEFADFHNPQEPVWVNPDQIQSMTWTPGDKHVEIRFTGRMQLVTVESFDAVAEEEFGIPIMGK